MAYTPPMTMTRRNIIMLTLRFHGLMLALYFCLVGEIFGHTDMTVGRWLRGVFGLLGSFMRMVRMSAEEVEEFLSLAVSGLQAARARDELPMPDGLWARLNRLHPGRR